MTLFLLLLFCSVSSAVKHSLQYFVTGSSGLPNISELTGVGVVDGIPVAYCDGSNKVIEPRQDWVQKLLDNDPKMLEWHNEQCFKILPNFFRDRILSLKQQFNQSGGVHILQKIAGCEWDENTDQVSGVLRFGFNGEDFIELDAKKKTWIPLISEVTPERWDAGRSTINLYEELITKSCLEWLKKSWDYGKSLLQKTVLPSVSLLQKTPSSPVSCHATGFYPDRVMMFWRTDGEEIHEGVDHREILPNHDGTFQMSVDLNVSSVKPEDWRRCDCVFQLFGVEDSIVTQLNTAVIRTNRKEMSSNMAIPIIVVLVLILVGAAGFAVYKKKKVYLETDDPESTTSP
ncbi:major histocompatibility complex class I-related gene protein-like [Oreochromis aureus]|uniref:major histocompatibility complex class I-related gene protein-like n=1 Tax=Oreochromis aureus TaxID=47969 RepID=UPI001953DD28|nr:major histocompatibility complex class I-related gene protein-like [Oreochromis aureus]